jgi:hypothetical protein
LAAIAPVDGRRLAQGHHVGHPSDEFGVFDVSGGLDVQTLQCGCVHGSVLKLKNHFFKSNSAALNERKVAFEKMAARR